MQFKCDSFVKNNMIKPIFPLLIIASMSSSIAIAETDTHLSSDYNKCIDRSGGSDSAMLECNSEEWKRQDARLNSAYKKAISSLSPEKRKELQEIQRLWLKYTEAKCNFFFDNHELTGTLDRLVAATCSTTERAARVNELEDIANQ